MQRIFSLGVYAPIRYIIIAVLVLPGWQIIYGQHPTIFQNPGNNANSQTLLERPVKSVSWNILFKQNTSSATRKLAIRRIKRFLRNNYHHHDTILVFDPPVYCPCDSLLYNLNIRFTIDGSGGSVSSIPPMKPEDGSGDYVAIQHISNNGLIQEMEPDITSSQITKVRIPLQYAAINHHKVLAVIDTGIDTILLSSNMRQLLWSKSGQEKTMYNFLPYQNLYDLRDDHLLRHGTVVTTLALKALSNSEGQTIYPKIMILKALDSRKRGSVFSVSCALSYARKNKATVINASLGNYGSGDSVLLHYIKRCNSDTNKPILIFAAAGNLQVAPHVGEKLCDSPGVGNQLTTSRTFFPASWSPQLKHVLSITGLKASDTSCYYQNYSNEVVSLGVLNISSSQGQVEGGCCGYKIRFYNKYYEGSSFATPVACGMLMRYMLKNDIGTKQLIHEMAVVGEGPIWSIIYRRTPGVTKDGKYLKFPVKPL